LKTFLLLLGEWMVTGISQRLDLINFDYFSKESKIFQSLMLEATAENSEKVVQNY
jgi:hypothetical protein